MVQVRWDETPQAHDYPAAAEYLSLLIVDPVLRSDLIDQLRSAPILRHKAKDLLRASQLPLLPATNMHVAGDLKQISKRRPLSPILLVRGDLLRGFPLQIADGYHRVCASYYTDENTDIPCRMIDVPVSAAGPLSKAAAATKRAATKQAATKDAAATKRAAANAATRTPAKRATKRVAAKTVVDNPISV